VGTFERLHAAWRGNGTRQRARHDGHEQCQQNGQRRSLHRIPFSALTREPAPTRVVGAHSV
jgi:hypothetical protein